MTFNNNMLNYRIVLDTDRNLFMAIDQQNESKVAYGITIKEAVSELKKTI